MANPGTYTAYRQLKPLEGSVSDDMQQQQDNSFRRQAFKSQEDKVKKDALDKQAARRKEVLDGIKTQDGYATGAKSKDEFLIKMFSNAMKEFVPLNNILENPSKYSQQEVTDAQVKYNNLNKLAENTKRFDEIVSSEYDTYQKNVAEGKIFRNLEYEKNYQAGYGNKIGGTDSQGLPIVYFIDEDGDGLDDVTGKKGKIGDYESYAEIVSGTNKKYDFTPKFDMGKELLEDSKNLQSVANDKTLLTAYVNNQLFKSDGVTPTDKLKSFALDAGITDLSNVEALKKIANNYTNDVSLRVKPDTAQQALDQKIKQDAIDNKNARDRMELTRSEGEKNRESAAEARKEKLAQEAAGKTTTSTATMDANGNTITTTKSKGNNSGTKKPATKNKVYAGIDPKTGKPIYK